MELDGEIDSVRIEMDLMRCGAVAAELEARLDRWPRAL